MRAAAAGEGRKREREREREREGEREKRKTEEEKKTPFFYKKKKLTVVPQGRPRGLPEEPPTVRLLPDLRQHPLHHRLRGLELLPDPAGPVVEVRRADQGEGERDEQAERRRLAAPPVPPRGDAGCRCLVGLVARAYREADGDGLVRGAV